ncbi:gamma-glutamylcyclotransferase family protein [Streptomyces sp. NPDC049597]|uniref:gamma-glutamylcyclotransferase family protein n=1 Tax=Streptomyces sp. NPDC049597 TaxID=3155276 RepID=UPI0034319A85
MGTGGDEDAVTEQLPFLVYGTLRPGEHNHGLFLAGRTCAEEPATLPGALLYDGPGYPYLVEDAREGGAVAGACVTAVPGEYARLLRTLDRLEDFVAPGHPRNMYERVAREAILADGTATRAWVYVAAAGVARELAAGGRRIAGGDWCVRTGAAGV